MVKYILKRLVLAIPLFLGITIFVYTLINLAPGTAIDVLSAGSANMSDEAVQQLEAAWGYDKPLIVRYGIWLKNLLQGDFGNSTRTNEAVFSLIAQRIRPSLILTLSALILALVVSLPLGVLAAYKPHSFWDKLSSLLAFIGASIPNFLVSLMLIFIFAVKLHLLPSQGMYDTGGPTDLPSLLRHLLLPAIVLALQMCGNFIKQTKGSVLESLGDDHIKTARAKGLRESTVVLKHAVRNALNPVVTSVGLTVPFLVGGAVITEQIFAWPGLGGLMIQSINTRDYNAVMGIVVIISVAVIIVNILIDVIYFCLDPRISKEA